MSFSYPIFVLAVALTIIVSTDAAFDPKIRSSCRQTSILQNLDVTRILGQWYEYSRFQHDFENGCDCLTSEITAVDSSSLTFQVSNCCQMTKISNDTQTCNIGINQIRLENPEKNDASFLYTRAGVLTESRVWIIDTDYENYMIIHGCDHLSDEEEREIFWIISRDKEINAMEVKKIDEVLKANNFERSKIIRQRLGVNVCKSTRPQREQHNKLNEEILTFPYVTKLTDFKL